MNDQMMQDKGRIIRIGMILLVLVSIFVFVKIIGEARAYRFIGSNPEVRSVISVSGDGEVFATPDVAVFSFGATAQAASATAASEAVNEKINPSIEYLKSKGVEEKDIKTTSYNIYPRYENSGAPCGPYSCPPQTSKIVGYEASQMIEVKVRDTELAGELITGVTDAGATNVSNMMFSIDDEDALKAEARAKAIEDAKEKAMVLAKNLDVKLVRIIEFTENGGAFPPYYMKEQRLEVGAAADTAQANLPTGENKIMSQVTITYEIR